MTTAEDKDVIIDVEDEEETVTTPVSVLRSSIGLEIEESIQKLLNSTPNNSTDHIIRGLLGGDTRSLISTSPDCECLAIFDGEDQAMKFYDVFARSERIDTDVETLDRPLFQEFVSLNEEIEYSLAISDIDRTGFKFVAISCFPNPRFRDSQYVKVRNYDVPRFFRPPEEGKPLFQGLEQNATYLIRFRPGKVFSYSMLDFGGLLRFTNESQLIILMPHGITQLDLRSYALLQVERNKLSEYLCRGNTEKTTARKKQPRLHVYPYPASLAVKLERFSENPFLLLANCVTQNALCTFGPYRNIEVHDLKNGELKSAFPLLNSPEIESILVPKFSLSKNRRFLAATVSRKTVAVILAENGILLAQRDFPCEKDQEGTILFIGFFDQDTKLAIYVEVERQSKTESNSGSFSSATANNTPRSNTQQTQAESSSKDSSISGDASANDYKIYIWDLREWKGKENKVYEYEYFDNFKFLDSRRCPVFGASGLVLFPEGNFVVRIQDYHPKVYGVTTAVDYKFSDFEKKPSKKTRRKLALARMKSYHLENDVQKFDDLVYYEPWNNPQTSINCSQFLSPYLRLVVGLQTIQLWCTATQHDSPGNLCFIWTFDKNEKGVIMAYKLERQGTSCKIHLTFGHSELERINWQQRDLKKSGDSDANTQEEEGQILKQLGREKSLPTTEPDRTIDLSEISNDTLVFFATTALGFFAQKLRDHPNERILINQKITSAKEIVNNVLSSPVSPYFWRLLDVNYDIVKILIEANCIDIVLKILNTIDDNKQNKCLHVPHWFEQRTVAGSERWLSVLAVAVEADNISLVQTLLEYYMSNADKVIGWMHTVTDVLPRLYENYPDLAIKILAKSVFGNKKNYSSISYFKDVHSSIPPNVDIYPFTIEENIYKLKEVKEINQISHPTASYEYHVVPLPDFITRQARSRRQYLFDSFELSPRNQFDSPFFQLISLDHTGEIFDNPAMEAVIQYEFKNHGVWLFYIKTFFYWFYVILFLVWSKFLLDRRISHESESSFIFWGSIVILLISSFLTVVEIRRMVRIRYRYFLVLYSLFDFLSCVLPFTTVVYVLSAGSTSCDAIAGCPVSVVFLSFTSLILCLQLFLRMRFLPRIGLYIYLIVYILGKATLFLSSQALIAAAFAYSMFILLHYSPRLGVEPVSNNFAGTDSAANSSVEISQVIDVTSSNDNYFNDWWKSWESVYFWISGRWDQLDQWDFFPVDVISLLASIFLVTVMQNLLIAHMTNAYDSARVRSRRALMQQSRTKIIMEAHEIMEILSFVFDIFGMRLIVNRLPFVRRLLPTPKEDPHYIFYAINSEIARDWVAKVSGNSENGPTLAEISELRDSNKESLDDIKTKLELSEIGMQLKIEKSEENLNRKIDDVENRIGEIEKSLKKISDLQEKILEEITK